MAHKVKELVTKQDVLNLTPRIHMAGEKWPPEVVLWPPHVHTHFINTLKRRVWKRISPVVHRRGFHTGAGSTSVGGSHCHTLSSSYRDWDLRSWWAESSEGDTLTVSLFSQFLRLLWKLRLSIINKMWINKGNYALRLRISPYYEVWGWAGFWFQLFSFPKCNTILPTTIPI